MSNRTDLATKCKLRDLSFWVRSFSAQFQRSLAGHGGIGIEGERFEDLGEGARRHQITAELFEDEWLKLKAIYTEGRQEDFTHPLFGVYRVRIESISVTADHREMVDATITVVEDGERLPGFAFESPNLGAVKFQWDSVLDDITLESNTLVTDGFDITEYVDDTASALFATTSAAFTSAMDLAVQAEAAVDEIAAAYSDYASAAFGLADLVESGSAVFSDLGDLAYESIKIAQDAVRSVSVLDTAPWNNFLTRGPVLIGSLAADLLGADTEDNIDLILQYNPSIIDAGVIPAGVELVIPVTLGAA